MRALREDKSPAETGETSLPDRVREVVAARLDRLDERAQHVLTVIAVIGRGASFPLIQRVAGLDESATAEGVEELVRRRVLQVTGERFELAHDWIRSVVYERLLPPRRRGLHAAVGRALEELHAEHPEEVYDRLAHHFARADAVDPAVWYLVRFSEQAVHRYALEDAVRALREARGFVERLPAETRDRGSRTSPSAWRARSTTSAGIRKWSPCWMPSATGSKGWATRGWPGHITSGRATPTASLASRVGPPRSSAWRSKRRSAAATTPPGVGRTAGWPWRRSGAGGSARAWRRQARRSDPCRNRPSAGGSANRTGSWG